MRNERSSDEFDPSVPNVARMYNYGLRGKDNFEADRALAEEMIALVPKARLIAQENRRFLLKAVQELADQGIRQFLDIGAGFPTEENVHQVALERAPDSRIVYVDNDPEVLAHARALLADNPQTIVVDGDLRDPKAILTNPAITAHLDFSQPIAVLLAAVLHFIVDDAEAGQIIERIREVLAPGSHLVISHSFAGQADERLREEGLAIYARTGIGAITARTPEQLEGFLHDMEILEPGIIPVEGWRPEWDDVVPDWATPGLLAVVAKIPTP
ncbi:SAM-dependent methyltransferase [Thermopolyspora sp. NPDC052614]|uniref:SAM-dependent methyltransferase n=1 Tax=Thermopolyspora sp. NPDC052614 TaxID=3155682 RepID=UPI00341E23F2